MSNPVAPSAVSAAVLALLASLPALAQDKPADETQRITITATKRLTPLQDTPLAVTAFSAATSKRRRSRTSRRCRR